MTIIDDLPAALAPWLTDDLQTFTQAIAAMFAQVEGYTADDPYGDGQAWWSVLLDPDVSPYPDGLAFLAQWIGERLPAGISEDDARHWVTDGPNQRRGTVVAVARGAQRSLIGSRLVLVFERQMPDGTPDPNGDHFTVVTYAGQTPDPAQVWADLLTVIPADMVCYHQIAVGQLWSSVHTDYATWGAVNAHYPNWGSVLADVQGANVWTW